MLRLEHLAPALASDAASAPDATTGCGVPLLESASALPLFVALPSGETAAFRVVRPRWWLDPAPNPSKVNDTEAASAM
jgi:hypothetical protein